MPRYLLSNGNTIIADSAFIAATYPDAQPMIDTVTIAVRMIDGPTVINALTDNELLDLLAKVKTNAQAELAYARLQRLPLVPTTEPILNAILDKMVAANIISSQRKTAILS